MLTVWICWQPPANSESRLDVVCVYLLMFYGSDSQHFLAITQLSRMIFLIPPTGVDKRTFPRKLCKTRLLLVQSGTILDMKQHLIILMEFSILFRQIYIYYFTHWKFHYPLNVLPPQLPLLCPWTPPSRDPFPLGEGHLPHGWETLFYGVQSGRQKSNFPIYIQLSPFYIQSFPFNIQLSPFYIQLLPFYIKLSLFYIQLFPFYIQLCHFIYNFCRFVYNFCYFIYNFLHFIYNFCHFNSILDKKSCISKCAKWYVNCERLKLYIKW